MVGEIDAALRSPAAGIGIWWLATLGVPLIRYREFAISTASLAGLSLAAGCITPANIGGDWQGDALIRAGGATFDLPFNFSGTITSPGWFGTATSEFDTYTMDIDLSIEKGEGTLTSQTHKIYTYTYDYGGGYEPYVADVDFEFSATYTGPVTRFDNREFDIVMDQTDSSRTLVLNGDPVEEEEQESLTTLSAVLQCWTNGDELHCDRDGDLLIFTR